MRWPVESHGAVLFVFQFYPVGNSGKYSILNSVRSEKVHLVAKRACLVTKCDQGPVSRSMVSANHALSNSAHVICN